LISKHRFKLVWRHACVADTEFACVDATEVPDMCEEVGDAVLGDSEPLCKAGKERSEEATGAGN
jgi:hypothetical protein